MMRLYNVWLVLLLLTSCTEQIKLDLSDAMPRLVVDATVEIDKSTPDDAPLVRVYLSKSADFFAKGIEDLEKIGDAKVYITSDARDNYLLKDITQQLLLDKNNQREGIGEYMKAYGVDDLVFEYDRFYTLYVEIDGQQYESIPQKPRKTPSVTKQTQEKKNLGFTQNEEGEESYEIAFYVNDPIEKGDYYIYKIKYNNLSKYTFTEDEFSNGKEIKLLQLGRYKIEEELELDYEIYSVDERYYSYMRILNSLSGNTSGGPFNTQPVEARGNMFNKENAKDNPFGYFRVIEKETGTILLTK